ncbi:putative hydrolase [Sphingobium jiangsuense]|uniref:Pimeloyl-ACP methyl ester carboxylesterase n=1 Tax=Sphingobium jiangsuense TaxID=870476 RepID=A0A7W6FPD0_9SPHN|nr:alpha/beta hydrolase [Sphingobium jiangsuense]MBB3925768.1 pimeloyl-ACP methyl ester carboxylesterase [Sphingobium jiangsuense]GLT02593.1 putative hydrolase [Sphingobium jiangsuense]
MLSRVQRFRSADGTPIVADIVGAPDRPTVVLAHGGGQTRHSWNGALRALAGEGYRVINYDGRGHGDSGWSSDGVYTLDLRAQDLRAVLTGTTGPVALVGASMGGATAMKLVSDGYRPAALILVDIVPRPEKAGVQRIIAFMRGHPDGFASLEEAAAAIAAYNPDRPRPSSPEGLHRNLRLGADGRYRWHWDPMIVQRTEALERSEIEDAMAGLAQARSVPALVVRGMHSDVVSDESIDHFRTVLPHLEVFQVPGAGHMVAGDRNDAFNGGIVDFLHRHMPVMAS